MSSSDQRTTRQTLNGCGSDITHPVTCTTIWWNWGGLPYTCQELYCCVCAPHIRIPSLSTIPMNVSFFTCKLLYFHRSFASTFPHTRSVSTSPSPVSFIFLSTGVFFSRPPSSAVDPHVVKQQQIVSKRRRAHLVPGCCLKEGSNIRYEACDWLPDLEKSHHLVRMLVNARPRALNYI